MVSAAQSEDRTGLGLVRGSYEEALKMIGHSSPVIFAAATVNWGMIKYYASLIEDGNPSYWDEEFAGEEWGGIIAPPGMLMAWLMPVPWDPEGVPVSPLIATQLPLPGETLINVATETEYLHPIRVGDHLNMTDAVVEITPEKKTRLGTGHFITTVATYRDQFGEVKAKNTNHMFRYTTKG